MWQCAIQIPGLVTLRCPGSGTRELRTELRTDLSAPERTQGDGSNAETPLPSRRDPAEAFKTI
jgi:hypothetical protein